MDSVTYSEQANSYPCNEIYRSLSIDVRRYVLPVIIYIITAVRKSGDDRNTMDLSSG